MKISYIFVILIFLSLNLVSASLGSFEQRECVDIKTILNTTQANISTINYPNLSTAISIQPMTKLGQTFNYTFCDTSTFGKYIYDYVDLEGNVYVNDFTITKNGFEISPGEALLYLALFIANLTIFALFLFLTIVTPFDNITEPQKDGTTAVIKVTKSKYMKLIAAWLTYGSFLYFITLLTGITQNYINFIELKSLMTNLYTFSYLLAYGVSVAIMWLIFWYSWKDIVLNKQIIKFGKALMNKAR